MSRVGSLPEDIIDVILRALADDPASTARFIDGLGKRLHFLTVDIGSAEVVKLVTFLDEWLCDARLITSPEWRTQVEASERAEAAGALGAPVGAEDLRTLLHH